MIIAQISDTHIALDTDDADQRTQDFSSTIADINALDPAPDVIVHTGDIVQNGRDDEYAHAAAILAQAHAPVYVMAGNKDDREALHQAFSHDGYLNESAEFIQYMIDDFSMRMIMLDTLNPDSNKGEFCQHRVKSLQTLASGSNSKPVAIFTHHPPFMANACPDPLQFDSCETMEQLHHELQAVKHLAGVYCGHVHRFDAGSIGGIPIQAMPSIATSLRKGEYPTHMQKCPVYFLHKYSAEWGVQTQTRIVKSA